MTEQYKMGSLVSNYLEKLKVHPITIAMAVADDKYQKSYRIIQENPQITKEEFLKKMELEEDD